MYYDMSSIKFVSVSVLYFTQLNMIVFYLYTLPYDNQINKPQLSPF